jgi:hypothetical protein
VYPAGSSGHDTPGRPGGPPPAPPVEPVFQVTVTKHTGGLVFWYNQRRTVTGGYAQCDTAITKAQLHNLFFGWWSIASLLWNPISLFRNVSARKALRQQAEQAHQYAQWCVANYGGGPPYAPVWAPPPAPPGSPQRNR